MLSIFDPEYEFHCVAKTIKTSIAEKVEASKIYVEPEPPPAPPVDEFNQRVEKQRSVLDGLLNMQNMNSMAGAHDSMLYNQTMVRAQAQSHPYGLLGGIFG